MKTAAQLTDEMTRLWIREQRAEFSKDNRPRFWVIQGSLPLTGPFFDRSTAETKLAQVKIERGQ
jgi:hypothetical protein